MPNRKIRNTRLAANVGNALYDSRTPIRLDVMGSRESGVAWYKETKEARDLKEARMIKMKGL